MEESDLIQVLDECKKTAKVGYKIASSQEKNLSQALTSAQEKLQSTIIDFNTYTVNHAYHDTSSPL